MATASSPGTKFARRARPMDLLAVPALAVPVARAHRRAARVATVRRHGVKGTKVRLRAAVERIARPDASAVCLRSKSVRPRFTACAKLTRKSAAT
jgi:hypothetical protein